MDCEPEGWSAFDDHGGHGDNGNAGCAVFFIAISTIAIIAVACADDICGRNKGQPCERNCRPQDSRSDHPYRKLKECELLDESGDIALFAVKTESDIAFNKKNDWLSRNSLFMRRRSATGTNEWRLVMTAEGDWKLADGMSEWCKDRATDARRDFHVMKASMSKGQRGAPK